MKYIDSFLHIGACVCLGVIQKPAIADASLATRDIFQSDFDRRRRI